MSPQPRLPSFHLPPEKGAMKYAVSIRAGARNYSANDLGGGCPSGTPLAGGGAGPGGRCPPGGVPPAEGTRGCAPSCNG
jgi:hypothetical protein